MRRKESGLAQRASVRLLIAGLIIMGVWSTLRFTARRLVMNDSAYFKTGVFWNGKCYCGFEVNAVPERMTDWIYAGDIAGVTAEKPTVDLQIRADVPVTGEVYVNSDCPEVIYGRLIWGERTLPAWVRLVTMRHQFKVYLFANEALYTVQPNFYGSSLPALVDLPPNYRYWGEVRRGNKDRVPDEECTSNSTLLSGAIWVSDEEAGIIYICDPAEEGGYYIPAFNLKLWRGKNMAGDRQWDMQTMAEQRKQGSGL